MMLTKIAGGVLAVSLANLAFIRLSGPEPLNPAARQGLADACQAALPENARGASKASLGAVKRVDAEHYWVTLAPGGGAGTRPVACGLVRDHESWRVESVTVIEW